VPGLKPLLIATYVDFLSDKPKLRFLCWIWFYISTA